MRNDAIRVHNLFDFDAERDDGLGACRLRALATRPARPALPSFPRSSLPRSIISPADGYLQGHVVMSTCVRCHAHALLHALTMHGHHLIEPSLITQQVVLIVK